MSAPHRPDLEAGLARFLSDTFGRHIIVSGLSGSSAGARRLNVVFDARSDGGLLRLAATILPTSEIEVNPITAEAAVRDLAERHGVPTPHIYGVCADSSYVGGPFFVSQRVDGESVPRRVLRMVHAAGIGVQVAEQLGEALGRLHAIDPGLAPAELLSFEKANPAEQALSNAEAGVDELLSHRPTLAMGLRWLERRLPGSPRRRAIVHTDARTGNLIVDRGGLRAVLDWEGAHTFGDPMQDLSWPATRMWRFREDDYEIGGLAGRAPFVAGYERAGGEFDLERYEWWKVMNALRWACGLARQAAAHLDGRFSNIVMAASGRRVVEQEWDLLMLLRP